VTLSFCERKENVDQEEGGAIMSRMTKEIHNSKAADKWQFEEDESARFISNGKKIDSTEAYYLISTHPDDLKEFPEYFGKLIKTFAAKN
jgi:hypothetical protein